MTVSRDRWQLHLKTRGEHYHTEARKLSELHARRPEVGAGTAALALHALADVLEAARAGRLTRNQHVLLRLGELIAWAEGAGSLVRRAARALDGKLGDKADRRFTPDALATLSRVFAREAALKVAGDGWRWIVGASDGIEAAKIAGLELAPQFTREPAGKRRRAVVFRQELVDMPLDLLVDHLQDLELAVYPVEDFLAEPLDGTNLVDAAEPVDRSA